MELKQDIRVLISSESKRIYEWEITKVMIPLKCTDKSRVWSIYK